MTGLGRDVLAGGKAAHGLIFVGCNASQQRGKFVAGKFPGKGLGMAIAQVFVKRQTHADGIQVWEIVRRQGCIPHFVFGTGLCTNGKWILVLRGINFRE